MKTLVILAVALILVLTSCDTAAPEPTAQRITVTDLETSPGYAWYPSETTLYNPSLEMVDSVRNTFNPATQKVVLFVKPGCTCRGTTKLFPQIMKTLLEANVPQSQIEVWSMRGTNDKQPYSATFTISSLPSVYVFRNDVVVAEVHDDNFTNFNADTLIANAISR